MNGKSLRAKIASATVALTLGLTSFVFQAPEASAETFPLQVSPAVVTPEPPSPSPSPAPTASPTPTPTSAPAPTASPSPAASPTPSPSPSPSPSPGPVVGAEPVITVASQPLDASRQSPSFTATLANGEDIVGDVTWLLDDSYIGKSHAAPHSMPVVVAGLGAHKLKARWVEDGVTVFVVANFTVGAYLTYGEGLSLNDANVAAPLAVTIANGDDIDETVTWFLDDALVGFDEDAPYEWQVVAGIGEHTLTAQWPGRGTSIEQVSSVFMVQTDLNWRPPAVVYEEPAPALQDLWVTADNRREPVAGLYDWSKAGFGGGSTLPSDVNVRPEATCSIDPAQMISTYGVVPNDGVDDTAGIQAAIDHIKSACSPTGELTIMSRITLPQGTLNVSREIHVDADYLIIRGAGSDPVTGTRLVYLPDANTRYDTITGDGTRWDIDGMSYESANGGWLWPGRGLFRVQSREVADRYAAEYAAAPENRKDLYEGTVNTHWVSGLTLRSKPGDPGYAARKGDTVIYLSETATYDNLHVGGLVNVMVANSLNFYASMEALPTEHELENLYMRRQMFMVVAGDLINNTITLDKPLEFDVAVTSISDGSEPIDGKVMNSKVAPLVDSVVGVGFEDLYITQDAPGLDAEYARANYGNMDPAGAMHGIVFKWATNSWVKGIRTEMTGSHPIVTEDVANLSVIDNYFDGAWNKGKGGNGYVRGSRVWDSLYTGNTLRNLRHFTFQWSASGNVFIGNSLDSDMNLHGGYERNNLFELNEVSVPYTHRPDSCWTNCGDEGGTVGEVANWYPIWWAAGKKAVKWSGSSGPNNVFFNNHMRKQLGNDTTEYQDWNRYAQPTRIYQFGVDASGNFKHLTNGGSPIPDWAGHENEDFTDGNGVVDTRTSAGRSLFLLNPVLEGYSGPNPQPLRRTWGCSCWDGRGMVNTRLAADPVNTASGGLMENFTDLTLATAGAGMTWGRTYNSQDPTPGPFGPGWTFDHNASLRADPDGFFYLREPTGAISKYSFDAGTGKYTATDPGVTAVLTDRAAGGWTVTSRVNGTFEFDASGRLVRMVDTRGLGVDLTYTAGQLALITDDLGQTLEVTWSGVGTSARITEVEASDGKSVSYEYTSTAGDLRLVTVTGIDDEDSTYGYDAATGFLNTITDPSGAKWARTTYDPVTGRVVSQIDPTGAVTTFAWDGASQTATITAPSGEVRQDIYRGNVLVAQVDNSGRVTTVSYDDDNHPIEEVTAAQQRTLLEYDDAGNLIKRTVPASVTQPEAIVETWTYDGDNRLLSHVDPLGGTTTYTYDAMGNTLTQTDALGATTTWTYNSLGQVLTETDPLSNVTTMAYDAAGDLVSMTSPGGRVTTYTYDASHNRISQTSPQGNVAGATPAQREAHTTHWTYDVFGRVLTTTDPLDRVTSMEYDKVGNLIQTTSPNGAVTSFTYDDFGRILTTTNALGDTGSSEYDDSGNLVRQTGADGAVVTWEYNAEGQMISMTDPIGNEPGASAATVHAHTTRYSYDTAGRLTTVRVPDPDDPERFLANTTLYDDLGRPVATTDPLGAVSRTQYDALGRVVKTVDPTGVTATASYDAVGRVVSSTASGATVTIAYDAVGRELSRTTDDGAITTFEYGLDGELVRVVSPLGNVAGANPLAFDTEFEYDANGNQTAVVDPLGRRTTNAYDGAGHVVSTTDALTHTTLYTYTALGAVATVTNAAGATTTYGYDELGRAVSATSPNGGVSTTEYDDAGRVASSTSPGGRTTTYSYDANGNVVLADLPDGEILRAYNSLGQPTLVDYSDTTPDVAIEYDRAGRAKEVSNGAVTAEYEYDLAGRVLEIARGNSTFSYGYDDEGRLVSKQYPDERSETFEWGVGSRLAAMDLTIPVEVSKDVFAPVTNTVGYTYDAAGRLVQTARTNGPTTSNTFDAAGQLVGSVTVNGATAVTAQTVQWDAVGLPSQVTTTQSNSTKTVLYGYDVLGQVTSQCSPTSGVVCKSSSPKVTYAYDANGNRTGETSGSTSTVHTYDVDDRLVTSTVGTAVTSYAYGLNGELDSVTSPTGTVQYAYGLDGNLYNAVLADGRSVAMAYDESGNRIQRNVNGVMTAKWVWDTNAALPVRTNETGSSTYRWFEDPQSSLGTAVASVSKDGEPTWLITDFSGTTLTTTKTAGATSSAKFDPFGNVLSGSMSQPLQFHGQYKDSVLGLYDMRQRDYNPVTGMFLATDPITVPVGDPFISRYSYGFNNPLVFTDASGLRPLGQYDYADVGRAKSKPFTAEFARDVVEGVWRNTATSAVNSLSPVMIYKSSKLLATDPGAFFGQYGQAWDTTKDVGGAWCSAWGSNFDVLQGDKSISDHVSDIFHSSLMGHIGNSWDEKNADEVSETYSNGLGIAGLIFGLKTSLKPGVKPSPVPTAVADTGGEAQALLASIGQEGRTAGVLNIGGELTPLVSGKSSLGNYAASGHVEGQAALIMRERGVSTAELYIDNPNGICGYCTSQVPTLLPEGAQLTVRTVLGTVPPSSRWFNGRTFTGNAADPKEWP